MLTTSRSAPDTSSMLQVKDFDRTNCWYESIGSLNGIPNAIATSRATPRMESAYPRSGVTAISITLSLRPSSCIASSPTDAVSEGSTMIPE